MCGDVDPNQLWEIVLYAAEPLVRRFPRDLFFDDELIWHQQQFGRPGQIATANLVVEGNRLYSMVHISDLVQRISRRPEHRSQVENRFRGWNHMLLNSLLHFALQNRIAEVHLPTAEWAMRHTDSTRTVGPELFDRVYDRTVRQLFEVERHGPWWRLDVRKQRERVVSPTPRHEALPAGRTICVCHDIERGYGHRRTDPDFSHVADATSDAHLDRMLDIENDAGMTATYNVVGILLPAVRSRIEAGGHCLGFHSYDHEIEPGGLRRVLEAMRRRVSADNHGRSSSDQLPRCRALDYRVKGYRPPQSVITRELTDDNLLWHNFEWLATSAYYLRVKEPFLENRLVKIPVHFDDFELYRSGLSYATWETRALAAIEANELVAFSLHDCYAHLWLPHYARLLGRLRDLGATKTLNDVASDVILASAQPISPAS